MNLQDLQKQIKEKSLDLFYIFLGEEAAIQKIYIDKMSKILNLEIQYIESFKSIYNKLNSNDIFNTKKLYIIIDDYDFIKQEKIWNEINNSSTNGNILIFKYNVLDKRNKFYKYYQDRIVEFNKLSDDILLQYIKKDLPALSDNNCMKLINMCDNNYNQILLEIDKLKMYIDYPANTVFDRELDNAFLELDRQGAFHKEVSDITFDFVEKVLKRDIKLIYNLREQLKQIGESNIKLLSLLYTNFKTVLLIQSCESKEICKTTGLQYYQVKYNQDKLDYYTIGELVNILRTIQRIEKSIKTGTIDEIISLDYLLVNIL